MAFKSIPCPICGDKLPLMLNENGDHQATCDCSGRSTIVAVVCKPDTKAPARVSPKADDKDKE